MLLENTIKKGENPVSVIHRLRRNYKTFSNLESNSLKLEFKKAGKFLLILNINQRPIVKKYCEGKLKRTLKGE